MINLVDLTKAMITLEHPRLLNKGEVHYVTLHPLSVCCYIISSVIFGRIPSVCGDQRRYSKDSTISQVTCLPTERWYCKLVSNKVPMARGQAVARNLPRRLDPNSLNTRSAGGLSTQKGSNNDITQ